jgi:hypothetical protein
MTLPCRWGDNGLKSFSGRVRFRRRFGEPRQIDAHERVWLTFSGAENLAEVGLNGVRLGRHEGHGPFEYEITSLLDERNELVVEVEAIDDTGGLWGEVALEIRCTAFLRAVQLEEGKRLRVSGQVIGTCERPLELYLLSDGATVAYGMVAARPEGQEFHLVADTSVGETLEQREVRIDLVNGAIIWHSLLLDPPERSAKSSGEV